MHARGSCAINILDCINNVRFGSKPFIEMFPICCMVTGRVCGAGGASAVPGGLRRRAAPGPRGHGCPRRRDRPAAGTPSRHRLRLSSPAPAAVLLPGPPSTARNVSILADRRPAPTRGARRRRAAERRRRARAVGLLTVAGGGGARRTCSGRPSRGWRRRRRGVCGGCATTCRRAGFKSRDEGSPASRQVTLRDEGQLDGRDNRRRAGTCALDVRERDTRIRGIRSASRFDAAENRCHVRSRGSRPQRVRGRP